MKPLAIFLCKIPARVTKENLCAIINAFEHKKAFATHSKESIKKY